jgi:PleD family two-component response regulator
MQIVSYRVVSDGSGMIFALGSDRSSEMEVVSQMAVLIEELEKEVNERIRLGQKLEELATTDGLTGVFNRRRFDEILNEEWQR